MRRVSVINLCLFCVGIKGKSRLDEYIIERANWEEVPPIFLRDGCYIDRLGRTAWIEFAGRAWKVDYEDAKRKLKSLCAPTLTEKEIVAAQTVLRARGISGKTREELSSLIKNYQDDKYLRDLSRRMRADMKRFIKEWRSDV